MDDTVDNEELDRFKEAVDMDRTRLPPEATENRTFDKFSTDTPNSDAAFCAESARANWYFPVSTKSNRFVNTRIMV